MPDNLPRSNPRWNFWADDANIRVFRGTPELNADALAVLRKIAERKDDRSIASELELPVGYVHLLQSLFCNAGWTDFAISTNASFPFVAPSIDDLIIRLEKSLTPQARA